MAVLTSILKKLLCVIISVAFNNYFEFKFVSDQSKTKPGFYAEYEIHPLGSQPTPNPIETSTAMTSPPDNMTSPTLMPGCPITEQDLRECALFDSIIDFNLCLRKGDHYNSDHCNQLFYNQTKLYNEYHQGGTLPIPDHGKKI